MEDFLLARQKRHSLSDLNGLGFIYLPLSISKWWLLILQCIATANHASGETYKL
jgi:hypothetical protein